MNCVCDEKMCTACGACEAKCPKKGIVKIKKKNGFYRYERQDEECNTCAFECPQKKDVHLSEVKSSYALQLKDKKILIESTSGGAFSAIAKYIFDNHGVVYGAAYMEDLMVKHIEAYNMDEIKPMQGSKYIQSDISDCFSSIKKRLENKEWVLFVGMPCQVAAVYAYLQKNYVTLITADLICSGVPSPKLWKSYLDFIENKYSIKVLDYKFRDKHVYGLSHTVVIKYIDGHGRMREKTYKNRNEISFYQAFGKQNCFNNACYSCKYNTLYRTGDFTLGGFWAVDRVETQLKEYDGISLVLANTSKAESIIPKLNESCVIEKHDIKKAILHNPALVEQTTSKKQEDKLWDCLEKHGYQKTSKRYFRRKTRIYNKILELKVVKKILNARIKR